MNSSFLLTTCAAAIGLFTFYRKFRFRQNNKKIHLSYVLPLPSSFPRSWIHDVFPSFHGPDVRRSFLVHFLNEFRRKGINSFIDNEIKRGEFIWPELKTAIQGSKIAIVLLSKNYASSSWCLDELVEIMKCKELGQTVMPIFYEVNPGDIKKQVGDFGKVFRKTCKGKTNGVIGKWKQALAEVATITGYHSNNWDNDAAMIEYIAIVVSNKLINSTLPKDFAALVGMGAHMENIDRLSLNLDGVRMIGIWGPPGIGKSTIARFLFNQHSHKFQLSVFMENVKAMSPREILSDNYSMKLDLQQKFISKIINQKDVKIPHLGIAQERLGDKKVLIVLDDVDRLVQLEAMAKETRWFGHGSWIIITTQDRKILRAHGINNIYKVTFPSTAEALQIFCQYAFSQKYPKDGFEELALEVVTLCGELPLGLEVMGSYLRRMSKDEWSMELPRLRSSLNREIENILKYSYDVLDDEDQYLFLHIACFFNHEKIEKVVEYLAKSFHYDVRQGHNLLAEKSLIYLTSSGMVRMHDLLAQLGKDIVRKKSIFKPGQRQFLVNSGEICEVLNDEAACTENVIGINFNAYEQVGEMNISEKAFEGMSSLQFLTINANAKSLHLPHDISYLSPNLRLLDWKYSPMTCFPSNVNLEHLVELKMWNSKLEKLWDGIKSLKNLKWMDLSYSRNLKELPNLSTATNLQKLNLESCGSLVELPSSIGNVTNLQELNLSYCRSLVELPSSIGNATNLEILDLKECSSLVSIGNVLTNLQQLNLHHHSNLAKLPSSTGNIIIKENHFKIDNHSSFLQMPSSIGNVINLKHLNFTGCSSLVELPAFIGNFHKLEDLIMKGCSKLEFLPVNINLKSLRGLNLSDCSSLKSFPEISTNIRYLYLKRTAIEEVPSSIRSWSRLEKLDMHNCKNLKEFPHTPDSIIDRDTKIQEVQEFPSRLTGCNELLSLPSELDCSKLEVLPVNANLKSLRELHLRGCWSLKRFPEISTNIRDLNLSGTAIEEVPSSIRSWPRLVELHMSHCKNLKKFAHVVNNIIECDTKIQEGSPLVKGFPRLRRLILNGCKALSSLPHLPDSLREVDADNCVSLERLDCSFRSQNIHLNFPNCFKLNKEARDLIIQKLAREVSVLPGEEIPTYFTYQNNGGSLIVKLNERPFPSSLTFKACILLISKNEVEDGDSDVDEPMYVDCEIMEKQSSLNVRCARGYRRIYSPLTEHLYIYKLEANVTSSELFFKFTLGGPNYSRKISDDWMIKECGVHYADNEENEEEEEEENEGDTTDEEEEIAEAF